MDRSPVDVTGVDASERLAEAYAPCFALILKLRSAQNFGDAGALRDRFRGLLDEARRQSLDIGASPEEVAEAAFAVVAFIDETVLQSDWDQKDAWTARSLQFELYERYDAGEEFFTKLERLRANPADNVDVLEVYYLCLSLGFQGRYQLQDSTETAVIAENLYTELKRCARAGAEPLSPHGTPGDQAFTRMRNRLPAWAVAAFTVVLAGIIYLAMSLHASSEAEQARAVIEGDTASADPAAQVASESTARSADRAAQRSAGTAAPVVTRRSNP